MTLSLGWSGDVMAFLALRPEAVASARARAGLPALQAALAGVARAESWRVALDIRLLRRGGVLDAAVITDRAVLAIAVRPNELLRTTDLLAAEDLALDLADFHSGSRGVPVVPVLLVPAGEAVRPQFPLPLAGAAPGVMASALTLPGLLRQISAFPPLGRDPARWAAAAYAPVPGLMEAACLLYAGHGVRELVQAGAGPDGVRRTRDAVEVAIARARENGTKTIVFVTGAPGAGKTLCGLELAFGPGGPAAFLTGNPTLVHVLREALVRDAAARGLDRRAARRRVDAVVQALPRFRDHYVASPGASPVDRVVVIDEAQRCWTREHAVRQTRKRPVPLADSEPGHLLDIVARQSGCAMIVCLLGQGQEIYDGEGGLAEWGAALVQRPGWRVVAPENTATTTDPRQRLPPGLAVERSPALHLAAPIRAVGTPVVAAWVDAVLQDAPEHAAALARAASGVPFTLTRSLDEMRAALRQRGTRTAGLVASSTARRLRAEGLGATLPHQDDDAVARWFLDRWPDVRSADALEVAGTEFAVQGLELDRVGLCWDADLVRGPAGWESRRFRANAWTRASAAARANKLNAYRVLLTRARHGTIIWVPRGAARDPTRDPRRYDAIAAYLHACGAAALDGGRRTAEDAPAYEERALL